MAGAGLLALLDDITTVLDDVAVLTKVAAKKTAGVLGDDLALNAQQVSGIRAEREIPVVWAVGKGSFINKLILVPAALAISAFLPWLITPLLMVGGAYLCFEGFEKVLHKVLHEDEHDEEQAVTEALLDPDVNMADFERDKIKGAIRTDFILSAEIIVIALGSVKDQPFMTQAVVVAGIAILMTFGVYGLVAGIVKMDDLGMYLVRKAEEQGSAGFKMSLGKFLLAFAPKLMKFLSIAGTIAMFMVGGGIVLHGLPLGHHITEGAVAFVHQIQGWFGNLLAAITPSLLTIVLGLLIGAVVFIVVEPIIKIVGKFRAKKDLDVSV
ncbi:DUF808 domain-containing protein [Thiolinea disciformis]|uniref:DUF808 domain-containing protein n=1 Tax=Thiolinea disciformis TaxID=125614 RepID=UPI000375A8C8|nr:DUF808 domain-containing protein [Thiolinea disciformis]